MGKTHRALNRPGDSGGAGVQAGCGECSWELAAPDTGRVPEFSTVPLISSTAIPLLTSSLDSLMAFH